MISARDLAAKLADQCHDRPDLAPRFRGKFMGPRAEIRRYDKDWIVVAVDPEDPYSGPGLGMVRKSIAHLSMMEMLDHTLTWNWQYNGDLDRCVMVRVYGTCPMETGDMVAQTIGE